MVVGGGGGTRLLPLHWAVGGTMQGKTPRRAAEWRQGGERTLIVAFTDGTHNVQTG